MWFAYRVEPMLACCGSKWFAFCIQHTFPRPSPLPNHYSPLWVSAFQISSKRCTMIYVHALFLKEILGPYITAKLAGILNLGLGLAFQRPTPALSFSVQTPYAIARLFSCGRCTTTQLNPVWCFRFNEAQDKIDRSSARCNCCSCLSLNFVLVCSLRMCMSLKYHPLSMTLPPFPDSVCVARGGKYFIIKEK